MRGRVARCCWGCRRTALLPRRCHRRCCSRCCYGWLLLRLLHRASLPVMDDADEPVREHSTDSSGAPDRESGAADPDGVAWTMAVIAALCTPEDWAAAREAPRATSHLSDRPESDLREMLRQGRWVDEPIAIPSDEVLEFEGEFPADSVTVTTALIAAAGRGNLALASLLLDYGADPSRIETNAANSTDTATALMRTTVGGYLEMVNLLLLRGLQAINYQDAESGGTAYIYACSCDKPDIAEALIRAGADTHATCWHEAHGLPGSRQRVTGAAAAYFQGHYNVVERVYCVLEELGGCPPGSQLSSTQIDDWREAKLLLGRMDAAINPGRARLVRVAEIAKEAGNAALKRGDPTEAVRQYTLAVEALGQIDIGGTAVEKHQVHIRRGWRESPSAELLAICLTNRGVARLATSPQAVLAPEPMADFRAAISADPFYAKGYYRVVRTMMEQMKAEGWPSPAEMPEPQRSAFLKIFRGTLEVACHLVQPFQKPVGPLLHRMLEECGGPRQPPQLPTGVLTLILRQAFGSTSWRMNVLSRELRDALAQEPRQLRIGTQQEVPPANSQGSQTVSQQLPPHLAWVQRVTALPQRDQTILQQLPPHVAWAQRVVSRSSGWKLVVQVDGALDAPHHIVRDGKTASETQVSLHDALSVLSRLPFSELEVKGGFTPPFEPPYELRAKETTADAIRINRCIRELVGNGLKRLTATSFDLDPAVIAAWTESGGGKNATAMRLESVARMDSANFAEFSTALMKFISAANNLEELHLPLLDRNPATLRPVVDLICSEAGPVLSLRVLNLKHSNLGFEGAMVLLKWTQQESCKLTSLNLNSTFSLEDLSALTTLKDCCRGRSQPALTSLDLTQCLNSIVEEDDPYPDQALFSLPEILLRPGWALQVLVLSHQEDYMLCDIAVDSLCEAMRKQHTNSVLGCHVRVLQLTDGMIGDEGACKLAEIAKEPWSKLEELHLDHNSIGDQGILGFASAIASPGNSLKTLYLHGSDESMGSLGIGSMLAAMVPDQHTKSETCQLENLSLPECGDDLFELADGLAEAMDNAGIEFWQE